MAAPIVTLPQAGPIATRPRREAYYDTEGWGSGGAVAAKTSLFRNAAAFANTVGLTKTKGRDHNMDNNGGQLPQGQAMHVYSVCNKIRPLGTVMAGAAFLVAWDMIRRIRESSWATWLFGSTPYISVPTWFIPEGVGMFCGKTTVNAITLVSPSPARVRRLMSMDVTLDGKPVEIAPLESFQWDIEFNSITPTPTVDFYDTVVMKGIHLRGING